METGPVRLKPGRLDSARLESAARRRVAYVARCATRARGTGPGLALHTLSPLHGGGTR